MPEDSSLARALAVACETILDQTSPPEEETMTTFDVVVEEFHKLPSAQFRMLYTKLPSVPDHKSGTAVDRIQWWLQSGGQVAHEVPVRAETRGN